MPPRCRLPVCLTELPDVAYADLVAVCSLLAVASTEALATPALLLIPACTSPHARLPPPVDPVTSSSSPPTLLLTSPDWLLDCAYLPATLPPTATVLPHTAPELAVQAPELRLARRLNRRLGQGLRASFPRSSKSSVVSCVT